MIIDHIGMVVPSLDEGISQWEKLFGYEQMTEKVTNVRQKVHVVFLAKNNSCVVKLVEPMDLQSPIYKFALRGGGLHHLCFKCRSVNEEVNRFGHMGLHIISKPQPGEAFENEPIAFVYAQHGLNVELIDTDKKAFRRI